MLQDALKPAEKYAGEERREVPRQAPMSAAEVEEAIKNRKPIQTPFDVTQGAMDTIKGDQNMPKHPAEEVAKEKPVLPKEEPTGYAAKKENVEPVGADVKNEVKSAAEYHPAVQQKVGELTDTNLRTLAKAHGLNPDEYDFNARDEGRHRTERDRLVKEVTDQIGEDEKINLGRAAESAEKEGLFQGADASAGGRAKRAAKMFPRLRGPVDEFGNPKASGGAPDTVGTKEDADKDTEHFANAKKELGDKASISEVAKRAQEMKDAHAQVAAHNENGGSTFHPTKGDLNGKPAFSVGGEPEFKSPDLKMTTDGKELTPDKLNEFAKRPAVKEALDKHKDASVGTWYDAETDKTTTELVKTPTDKDEAIAMGQKNGEKAIYDLGNGEEIKTTNDKGSPIDEFGNPTVSGGAPAKLPTGDELIKKYGESSGDPKDLTFILKDGRGVANTGVEHDHMLGGKTNEKVPPRERFIAEGNIRIRPRQGTSGREVSMSIPETGVTSEQLKYIQKMSPQLRSGGVMIEVGKPGGSYKAISYGEASPEQLETTIRGLGPVLNDKGSPIDWNGNPTVSGGSPSTGTATAKAKATPEDLKANLPDLAQQHLTEEEKTGITTTETGKPRTAGTEKFVNNMTSIPTVQEYTDIALQGEGARKWYSRSTAAFDAMHDEAPDYFKEGDKQKFMGVLAGGSPQQSVAMNLRETLGFWKEWNDAGRPELSLDKWQKFGEEADKEWKDGGRAK